MLQPYRKSRFAYSRPKPASRRRFLSHRGHEIRVVSNPFERERRDVSRIGVAAWCTAFVAFLYIAIHVARTLAARSA